MRGCGASGDRLGRGRARRVRDGVRGAGVGLRTFQEGPPLPILTLAVLGALGTPPATACFLVFILSLLRLFPSTPPWPRGSRPEAGESEPVVTGTQRFGWIPAPRPWGGSYSFRGQVPAWGGALRPGSLCSR